MRAMTGVALGAFMALVACGESAPVGSSAATSAAPTPAPPSTTTFVAVTAPLSPPLVLAILSGRGDDGTFEVAVYFDRAPLDTPLVVGIDADDSYAGSGNPGPELDGWVELSDLIVVGSAGAVVAGGSGPSVGDWMSWGFDGSTLRIYFIRDLAPVAGTLWVVVGDGTDPGAVAGVVTGEGCSIRGSDRDTAVIGDFPDPGVPCRYP